MTPIELACHPSTPTSVVRRIVASVHRDGGQLDLRFVLEADLDRLRIPQPTQPHMTLGLWEHTCFEAFLRREGDGAYHEINLSPSGEWALFAFQSYREIGALPQALLPPIISLRPSGKSLQLDAAVDLNGLSDAYRASDLRLALAAVIEAENSELSYWGLWHPPGKADFHHPQAFTLRVAAGASV